MAPRITLITGCSSGIGLATAVALATDKAKGYIVYATMRNLAKKEALEKAAAGALNKTLFITRLDVKDEELSKSAVKEISDKHGRIDILVNNAGYGCIGFVELIPKDQMYALFETNFFGAVRLTQEVIPHMKKQRSGRIINVSSVAGLTAWPFCEYYAASKFALEGFTESLAMSLRPFNIWVSSIQPGPVSTEFINNIGPANYQPGLAEMRDIDIDVQSKEVMVRTMNHLTGPNRVRKFQTADEIANVIKGCFEVEEPHLRNPTSEYRLDYAKKYFVDPTGDSFINTIIPHMFPNSLKK